MKEKYFKWLCGLVGVQRRRGRSYFSLARMLLKIEYYGFIGNDRDRGSDGLHLRFLFANELFPKNTKEVTDILDGPCSVLEMLVAMSMRLDDWLEGGSERNFWTKRWFFEMLKNLALDIYDDDSFLQQYDRPDDIVRNKVENWLERRYLPNGFGGLFPLKNPDRDQRHVEIWYQLNDYLKENYKNMGGSVNSDCSFCIGQERSDLGL